jgi:hypothetical protein
MTRRGAVIQHYGSDPSNPPGQMVHLGVFANSFSRPFDGSADALGLVLVHRALGRPSTRCWVVVSTRNGSAPLPEASASARSVLMYVHAIISLSVRHSSAAPVKWSRARSPRTHVAV